MEKWANVDFERCRPAECGDRTGKCAAVSACTHRLLEQEEENESPMLLSIKMCVGCGDCARVCSLSAIDIAHG